MHPTNPVPRRSFLKNVVIGAATAGLTNLPRPALAVQYAKDKPSGNPAANSPVAAKIDRLKVSLNAYTFNTLLLTELAHPGTGVTLLSLLDFCDKYKFDAIDATGYYFPGYPNRPTDAYIDAFKAKAASLGIAISGSGVNNNFTTPDKSIRDADVRLIKDWVEVAARLGAPVLRVFADTRAKGQTWQTVAKGYTREQVQQWIADSIRECADYARKFNVKIGIQNHADFLQTGQQHLALIKAVDSLFCGPILDVGSFKTADPYLDIALVAPHAINWQIKTNLQTSTAPIPVDIPKLIHIIRTSGYQGYLPIETLASTGSTYDPYVLVPKFLADIRQAIAQTA